MKPYISNGNRKMSFPTFSLLYQKTCPGSTALCRKYCYAKKAELAYPAVLPSRTANLKASKQKRFVDLMVKAIMAKGKALFRIHDSGDFYSQAYLEAWFEICRACPDIKFLAFTKSFRLDFSDKPDNLQIVWSVWPDTDRSEIPRHGPRAFAGDCDRMGTVIECAGNCDACGVCWHLDQSKAKVNVHFKVH